MTKPQFCLCNFTKTMTPLQVFSVIIEKTLINPFSKEHLLATASAYSI